MSKAGLSQTIDGFLRDTSNQFSSIKDTDEVTWLIDESVMPSPDQALRSVDLSEEKEVHHYAVFFTELALTHLKLPTHIKRLKEKHHSARVLRGLQKVHDENNWNILKPFLLTSGKSAVRISHIKTYTEADKIIGPCALTYEEYDKPAVDEGFKVNHVIVHNDIDLICIYATAPAYKNIWFTNLRSYFLSGSQISERLSKSGFNFNLPMNIELFPFVQLYTRPNRDVQDAIMDEFEINNDLLTDMQKSFILGMAQLGPTLESVRASYQMLRKEMADIKDDIAMGVKIVKSVAPEQNLPLVSDVYTSLCKLWPGIVTMNESDFRREYKAIYCVDYDEKEITSVSATGLFKTIQVFCADFLVPEDAARESDVTEPCHLYNTYGAVSAGDLTENEFLNRSVRDEFPDAINLLPAGANSNTLPTTAQSIINLLAQKSDDDIRDMIIDAITPGIEALIAKLRSGMSGKSS